LWLFKEINILCIYSRKKKVESYIFDNGITSVVSTKNLPEEEKRYEEEGMVYQNTTVIFGGAFYLDLVVV
jgi:hypothetical protein